MGLLIDKWRREVLASLLPRDCLVCGRVRREDGLCPACRAELPWNHCACPRCARPQSHAGVCARCLARPPAFDSAWSPFRLEPPVQHYIHGLKYQARWGPAALLARLMAEAATARVPVGALLLPVPLHRWRLWRRGYNQSLELARHLARALPLELVPLAARRVRATEDQIGRSAAERRRNLRQAFAVDSVVSGRSVILLDDVMTTGATLHELARACRRAGARELQAWALARVP